MIEYSCPKCHHKEFTLVRKTFTNVDFSKEGAIKGHPYLISLSSNFEYFTCCLCGKKVPSEQAKLMLTEVM